MKRFRVLDFQRNVVFKSETTEACFKYLKTQDMGLSSFSVEDVVDDIEVDADDFVKAFDDGEDPGDLQFF